MRKKTKAPTVGKTLVFRRNVRLGAWLRRMVRFRLILPTLRSGHSAEYTARGVCIGVSLAFTPLIGVQMPLVVLIWLAFRQFIPSWNFLLLVALAWTWVTNVVTLIPIYYAFYITGQVILWRWDSLPGFRAFSARMQELTSVETTWIEAFWIAVVRILDSFGLPIFVGSAPYAVALGWLSYRWSLRLIYRLRTRRRRRREARGKRRGKKI